MEIVLFFGLLGFILALAYFYFNNGVVYFGAMAGIIVILMGTLMGATSFNFDKTVCFSNQVNETTVNSNLTTYDYVETCHTEKIPLSRDLINAIAAMFLFVGAGMIVDFINHVKEEPEKKKAFSIDNEKMYQK